MDTRRRFMQEYQLRCQEVGEKALHGREIKVASGPRLVGIAQCRRVRLPIFFDEMGDSFVVSWRRELQADTKNQI